MKFLKFFFLFIVLSSQQDCSATPTLKVYTFSAMASKYGSGHFLKEAFEAEYNCIIQWIPFDTGILLLNRLKWEEDKCKADVVLGLDSIIAQEALDLNLFEDLQQPKTFGQSHLIPYSRVSLAFVYDQNHLKTPPTSFQDLIKGPYKILLQDPRTSMTGTALVAWIRQAYGETAPQIWKKLKPKILTFTRSWSEAYTLFQRGEGDLVLSYLSSPLYHEMKEGKTNYQAAIFEEGNLTIYEMAGVIKSSPRKNLAIQFIEFLRSSKGQNILATRGWQYPLQGKPKEWDQLITFREPCDVSSLPKSFERLKWIREWEDSYKR